MPALDDSVITKEEVEREDTAAVGAGLDALEENRAAPRTLAAPAGHLHRAALLALVLVLIIWEIVYLLGVKPEVMLPSPAAVGDELVRLLQGGQAEEDHLDQPVLGPDRLCDGDRHRRADRPAGGPVQAIRLSLPLLSGS